MKKTIIGAIVGGLLIFIWQTLSWTMLDLHRPSQDYTPKEDTIMQFLQTHLDKEGGYMLPGAPKGMSSEDMQKKMEKTVGKPRAFIQYHTSMGISMNDMVMNMLRGFIANVLMVWFLCWILSKWSKSSFFNVFLACIFTGLIVFINAPYTTFIWYKIFDIRAHLADALLGWGLCGLWLGWWMRRGSN